jgi:ABC-type antimicrobial peptide transport system permease subunit
MKYIIALLIILGIFAAIVGLVIGFVFVTEWFQEIEHAFECKHRRYYKFKKVMSDKVIPLTFAVVFALAIIFCLVMAYLEILNRL